jgi:hypothetical protein
VGIGPRGAQQVVMVMETEYGTSGLAPDGLRDAVRDAVGEVPAVLTVSDLPVDIRHNSKIDRVRLGRWAQRVLDGGRVGKP